MSAPSLHRILHTRREMFVYMILSKPADGNVTEPGVEPATCWLKDWGPNHWP